MVIYLMEQLGMFRANWTILDIYNTKDWLWLDTVPHLETTDTVTDDVLMSPCSLVSRVCLHSDGTRNVHHQRYNLVTNDQSESYLDFPDTWDLFENELIFQIRWQSEIEQIPGKTFDSCLSSDIFLMSQWPM